MISKVKYKAEGKSAKEVMDFIKLAIGDDLPHEKFCGHGAHTWSESVSNALCASYIFVCKSGMISIAGSESKLYFESHPHKEYKNPEKPLTKTVYERVDVNSDGGAFWEVAKVFAEEETNTLVARTNPHESLTM